MQKNTSIFDNTEIAFALKSNSELKRAYYLYKIISISPLVSMGTAITNFALRLRLPVEGIIRATIFNQFCAGINEQDCLPVVNNMFEKRVSSILDFSVEAKESEAEFDYARDVTLKVIGFCEKIKAIPIAVFKPSGFGRVFLYEKISKGETLTSKEQEEWERVKNRFTAVCDKAKANNITILIDAEESWIQDAIDSLITQLMASYNTKKAIVFNTLQMYRHDRLSFLKNEHKKAKENGYFLGYKLVRGAYMEKERERAEDKGYKSPICKNKAATDANFDAGIHYILDNLEDISLFSGTHNELSSCMLMNLITEKGISNKDPKVWFGQLYGMSDHISFNLANEGYNVAKYVPFGPVRDVMPYLIRRAKENSSVTGQMSRELTLLSKELKRRKQN